MIRHEDIENNGSCQAAHSVALCVGLIPEQDRALFFRRLSMTREAKLATDCGEVLQVFFIRASLRETETMFFIACTP